MEAHCQCACCDKTTAVEIRQVKKQINHYQASLPLPAFLDNNEKEKIAEKMREFISFYQAELDRKMQAINERK